MTLELNNIFRTDEIFRLDRLTISLISSEAYN